ncbi:MAG TPA: DUF3300 domain-containing protein [Pseudolabrys sp.]|nr:DUF3300 domain-containing protein [Pseudolabrys sp.]
MAAGAVITVVSSAAAMAPAAAQNLPAAATCTCPSGQDQGVYVPQQETVVRQQTALSQDQLDQILAPIALYPDNLLVQILTASTYPLEVTAAARWSKENPGVTGSALDQAMLRQPWDASVKGLTAVPQVLAMMNEQLDWTEQLGEAFLAQQDDVTRTVQMLRARAAAAGTLKDSRELKIVRAPAPVGAMGDLTEYIQIEPVAADVISVPVYDPGVVYGAWSYPNRRPFFWRPPGYAYAGAIGFGAAVTVGSALWTRYDWRERRVWIDSDRYNRFNRTNYAVGTQLGWRYNAQHRGNAPYRNVSVTREYVPNGRPNRTIVNIPPGQTIRGGTTIVTPPGGTNTTIRREGAIDRNGGGTTTIRGGTTTTIRGGTTTTIRGGTDTTIRGGADTTVRGRTTVVTPPPTGRPTSSCNPPSPRPVGWEPPINCRSGGVVTREGIPPGPKPVTTAPPAPKPTSGCTPPSPRPVGWEPPINCRSGAPRRETVVTPKPPATPAPRTVSPPPPKPAVAAPKPPAPPAPKPPAPAPKPVSNPKPAPRPALDCSSAGKPPGWKRPAACPR